VRGHGRLGVQGELGRIGGGAGLHLVERDADGQVLQRVVGRGLVGDDVDGEVAGEVALQEGRDDLGGVAEQADRQRTPGGLGLVGEADRLVEVGGLDVAVAVLDAAVDARLVALDAQRDALVHGDREGLGAAHAAKAGGEGDRAGEAAGEPLAGDGAERLVGALQDALGADVDPGAGRHLAVHHQALALELAEELPVRPVAHQVGVGDQDARGPLVGADDADRLARLDQERLVGLEVAQGRHDRVERGPAAGGASGAAVDDQLVGVLGDLGVEVVHQHAQGGLLRPALRAEGLAAGGLHGTGSQGEVVGHLSSFATSLRPPRVRLPGVRRGDGPLITLPNQRPTARTPTLAALPGGVRRQQPENFSGST